MARATDVAVARALYAEWSAPEPPRIHDGVIVRYGPKTGCWEPLPGAKLEAEIQRLDGTFVGQRQVEADDGRVKGIARQLHHMVAARASPLEATPGVAVREGFLAIEQTGGRLLAHSPRHGCTLAVDVAAPAASGAAWTSRVLRAVWDDASDPRPGVLQEFIGACLLGRAARYRRAVILVGRGRNGKSTILLGLRRLFATAPALAPADLVTETGVAALAGASINLVPELSGDTFPAPEKMKAVIAGDPLPARFLYGHRFTSTPRAGHIFATNVLPPCRDLSDAFWDRWLVLECRRVIPASEALPPQAIDSLLTEALPGLLHWAVAGAVRLLQRGDYAIPTQVDAARRAWRGASDPVVGFMADRDAKEAAPHATIRNHSTTTSASPTPTPPAIVLYKEFRRWCNERGVWCPSFPTFETRLRDHVGHPSG